MAINSNIFFIVPAACMDFKLRHNNYLWKTVTGLTSLALVIVIIILILIEKHPDAGTQRQKRIRLRESRSRAKEVLRVKSPHSRPILHIPEIPSTRFNP